MYMSGVGPKPIKPEPLRADKSADLMTVKNVSYEMQCVQSFPKHALSAEGCPRIYPLPYLSIYPCVSSTLKSFDLLCSYFAFLAGQLGVQHSSENNQAIAEPVSKITLISYDGFPNQKVPSYPMFFILIKSDSMGTLFFLL